MPRLLDSPSTIEAAGSPSKQISEYIGRVATGHKHMSVARMKSPEGWHEPGQRPEFDEINLVLSGVLRVEHEAGQLDVHANQAVIAVRGEWVRYSTPEPGGAEYVAICLPAFTEESAHRDGAR
jgi:mannose-6-phosphate isomerase-like protein (cupin superfamily)